MKRSARHRRVSNALYAHPPTLGTVGGRLMNRHWVDVRDKVRLVSAEDYSRSRREDDEGKRLARTRSEENKGPEGEKKREDHEQDRRGDTKGEIQAMDRRKDERKRSKDKKGPQEEKKK